MGGKGRGTSSPAFWRSVSSVHAYCLAPGRTIARTQYSNGISSPSNPRSGCALSITTLFLRSSTTLVILSITWRSSCGKAASTVASGLSSQPCEIAENGQYSCARTEIQVRLSRTGTTAARNAAGGQ